MTVGIVLVIVGVVGVAHALMRLWGRIMDASIHLTMHRQKIAHNHAFWQRIGPIR